MRKRRTYKVDLLRNKIEGNVILTKNEFYLLKMFGSYWTQSRKPDKMIYYLNFLIKEIEKNKLNLGTEETEQQ